MYVENVNYINISLLNSMFNIVNLENRISTGERKIRINKIYREINTEKGRFVVERYPVYPTKNCEIKTPRRSSVALKAAT